MGADRRKAQFVVEAVRDDLMELPSPAIKVIGFEIGVLQDGDMPESAKPMHGFDPAVIELRVDEKGDTFRCCVTVRLKHRIYILHVFKKKSTKGDETPQKEIRTIRRRLMSAIEQDAEYERQEQERRRRT